MHADAVDENDSGQVRLACGMKAQESAPGRPDLHGIPDHQVAGGLGAPARLARVVLRVPRRRQPEGESERDQRAGDA